MEEKNLNLEPEKIIHILLKHLMDLKNENAYLKKKAALHSFENGIPKERLGINNLQDGFSKKTLGINNLQDGIPNKTLGINNLQDGIPNKTLGINNLQDGIPNKTLGINNLQDGISKNRLGIKYSPDTISKSRLGIKYVFNDFPEKRLGIKSVSKVLSNLNVDTNNNDLLHLVFEQELLKAMEEYLKNGDGQTTLYGFYNDFQAAVTKQNSDAAKAKVAIANLRLEDTHYLPAKIDYKEDGLNKLMAALHKHLPRFVNKVLYRTIALELMLLQSVGKATGTEIRESSGMSVAGFAKHLPKLKSYNLIKKQAPSYYILTDLSNHILLELFGIPKIKV